MALVKKEPLIGDMLPENSMIISKFFPMVQEARDILV